MRTLTNQQIFTKVATHLLRQGRRSVKPAAIKNGGADVCLYRGPGNLKCAAGALIPDRLYQAHMDRKGAHGGNTAIDTLLRELGSVALFGARIGPEGPELIAELQRIHDNRAPEDWAGCLAKVAAENHFDTAGIPGLSEEEAPK